jgi:hypothetical protein
MSVSLVHPQRFNAPPETISDLLRSTHRWHLVRGQILALPPPGTRAIALPYDLPAPSAVLARVDFEELEPYARPRLLTVERGRDFYIADAAARDVSVALVRVADDQGRLHPDVELHLGSPFVEHALRPSLTGLPALDTERQASRQEPRLTAFVRLVAIGDPIYVLGRSRLEVVAPHASVIAGLRDAPLTPRFGGDLGPLHLYDEPAFRQLAAWYALPWYKKLSLLVRNR